MCPSLSRLDEVSIAFTQEFEKGDLTEEEVRDAMFYFKSDRCLMMVHYNMNDLTFKFQEYFLNKTAKYSGWFGWLTLPLAPDNHRYIVTGLKNDRCILHEFVVSDDDIRDLATIKDFSYSGYAHTILAPSTVIISGG